jgi:uncharacterized repeat protein (TIGR03803 family)
MTKLKSVGRFALAPTRSRSGESVGKSGLVKTACIVFVFCAAAAIPAPAQTYTDLYDMGATSADPNDPIWSGVIAQGRDGNMYSTTPQYWTGGPGDVFKITPTGTVTVLASINSTTRTGVGGLTLATDGKFYGTSASGGTFGYGTIFSITAEGSLTTLYSFTNGADGSYPTAPPIEGLDGNFYGTTAAGGLELTAGHYGSVYKISPSGVFTTLHTFAGTDGANPLAPLMQAADDNFYGTTFFGGTNGAGTIFRIGAFGKFEVLFNFDTESGAVPGYPFGALIQGTEGALYATTSGSNGNSSGGTVFKFAPGELKVLRNFAGGADGNNLSAGLVQATDGNFYGTNDVGPLTFAGGVIFRVSSTGAFATVHEFDYTHGGSAQDTPFQHTNGLLYGTTAVGGAFGNGVFYSLDVGLKPFVRFLPAAGVVGKTVQFLGQGFTGTTGVSFNGTPAAFTVVSDTFLTATVPAGATTGSVTVTTPSGTLTSNKQFRVTPQIKSFTPTSGPVGTTVVITGVSFNHASSVWLACKWPMKFTLDSDTQITATIPANGTTGEIMVFTPGGHVESTVKFTVTP